jgi:hypothetical protein
VEAERGINGETYHAKDVKDADRKKIPLAIGPEIEPV